MAERIFIKSGETFPEVPLKKFSKEEPLKKIIIEHPELIPINEIKGNPELYPISSEMETNHGPLDILGVDQHGGIYIIETKLYKNPDKRKIMAQVQDYSGGLATFKKNFELFKNRISAANRYDINKETILENKTFEQMLENIQTDEDDIISKIKKNFERGEFSYILVLDESDQQLKENVRFFNEKNDNRMYVVTISNFIPEGTENEMIISSIFGTEYAKHTKHNEQYNKWLEDGEKVFLKNLESNKEASNTEKSTVEEFLVDLKTLLGDKPNSDNYTGYFDWGAGAEPRFFARFFQIGHSKNWGAAATFNIDEDGSLRLRYPNRSAKKAQEFAEKFNEELRKIPCAKKLMEQIDAGDRKPLWEISQWAPCKDELMQIIHKVCIPIKDE